MMKETILAYLENNPEGVEVLHLLGNTHTTSEQLDELVRAGDIIVSKKGNVKLLKHTGYHRGVLSLHPKGFGFVKLDNGQEVYIPKDAIGNALPGVNVLITIDKLQNQKSIQGKIVKPLTSIDVDLVGLYQSNGKVLLDDQRYAREFEITNFNGLTPKVDDKILVHIDRVVKGKYEGQLIQIIGHKNDPGVDILSIIYTHQFSSEFSKEVLAQAEKVAIEPDSVSLEGRRDLTNMSIITIDGSDAKDLDDAIHVIKNVDGYELGVHIADVSSYVTEDSLIDNEAFARSTSVYLVDRVVPMLPHALSSGVCSLQENKIRLTMSCVMKLDLEGYLVSYEIFPSFIRSAKRFTYDEVNEILMHNNLVLRSRIGDLSILLDQAFELSKLIQNIRHQRGAIDFDIEETKLVVDDLGQVIDVKRRERFVAEKLIEDFMIMANECVAKHIHDLDLPGIYRVHEKPSELKLTGFKSYSEYLGHKLRIDVENVQPIDLQQYLEHIHSFEIYPILANQLLRSMAKAKYFETCSGHFGLASDHYTHFTSPIRRYPDLVIHRLLKKYANPKQLSKDQIIDIAKKMPLIAEQTSKKERDAIACEREVESLKKAQYMTNHLNEKFDGVITSIQSFGMFIELENTIEGLVHVLDMKDDFYIFNEKTKSFVGQRKKHVFRLGDKVQIKVKKADIITKTIDFVLVKQPNNQKRKKAHYNNAEKNKDFKKRKKKRSNL